MAAPSAPSKCLRLLSLPARSCPRTSTLSVGAQRYYHKSTPLYLDFLAPSWRSGAPASTAAQRTKARPPPLQLQPRCFSSTTRQNAKAITNPRKDSSGNEMSIVITPRAAHRLQTIAESDHNPSLALRVSVESGGCHGFQYLMSLVSVDDVDAAEDTIFENEEVARKTGDAEYKAKVVMDEPSLELLTGSSIDYTMELIGSQFKVTGIPGATSSCGCGTSFDIAG